MCVCVCARGLYELEWPLCQSAFYPAPWGAHAVAAGTPKFSCVFSSFWAPSKGGGGGEEPVSSRVSLRVGLGPCGRPPPIPSPHDAPRRSPQPVPLRWRPLPRPLPSFWCRDRFPWLPSSGPTGEAGFAVHVHGRSSVLVRRVLDTAVLEEGDVIRASWTCVAPSMRPRSGMLPRSKGATPDSSWPPPATGDRGPSDCMVVTASLCRAAASLVDGEV